MKTRNKCQELDIFGCHIKIVHNPKDPTITINMTDRGKMGDDDAHALFEKCMKYLCDEGFIGNENKLI